MKECTKIRFESAELASKELHRIIEETVFKPWKKEHKKACRIYQCDNPLCEGCWHLTSKPTIKIY